MKPAFLLDTSILIWALENPPKLPNKVKNILTDQENFVVYASVVNLWEITIKTSIKKIQLTIEIPQLIRLIPFNFLPITEKYFETLAKLPYHHKDPFDRMLISQAIVENLTIITSDKKFKKYNVPLLLV